MALSHMFDNTGWQKQKKRQGRKKDKIVANSVILLYNGKCEFKQIVKFKKSGVKINGKY